MDFKSAFWQIELDESSKCLTDKHTNDKLYRYKRLTMSINPAQGELNKVALKPLFMPIENAHLIYNDLILATKTVSEHIETIRRVMEVVSEAGLTLNPEKCSFTNKEINFWGMIFSADRMRPGPAKVAALDFITARTNKDELLSFLCMMQPNSDFIENVPQKAAPL